MQDGTKNKIYINHKYNIISMLLQKKSASQWLAKKNKLLAWGLSCAQNQGYIPSNFKPFYN